MLFLYPKISYLIEIITISFIHQIVMASNVQTNVKMEAQLELAIKMGSALLMEVH